MTIKKLKNDVRGSALVYVIVAAAIIILLGTAVTTTSYINLRTTQLREQANTNFYGANGVLNAIVNGLEGDLARAYETAYTNVIANSNAPDNAATPEELFAEAFKYELKKEPFTDGENTTRYNVKTLQKYAQNVFDNDSNPDNDLSYMVSALNGNNYLDTTDSGVIIRNIHVVYEDNSGYYDEITTDIKITIPAFDQQFIQDERPQLNVFVADDGLELNFGSGLQISGDVYLQGDDAKNAILLNQQSLLTIASPSELVAAGKIVTGENTRLTIRDVNGNIDSNAIWTENITLGRYTDANLSGQIFVYDDLEVDGSYADVKLSGKYYGYSKSEEMAEESSAINVNGAHTTLDIQDLNTMVLAGTSYISTSSATTVKDGEGGELSAKDIQIGSALSVKSNQIAFLVDPSGFVKDFDWFTTNPMTEDQYNNLPDNWMSDMLTAPLSYDGVSSYATYNASIYPVFALEYDSSPSVYFYLRFDDSEFALEDAKQFFKVVYEGDSNLSRRLRAYAAQYLENLKLNVKTNLLINSSFDQSISLYADLMDPTVASHLGEMNKDLDPVAMDNLLSDIKLQYIGTKEVTGIRDKMKYSDLIVDETILQALIGSAIDNETYTESQLSCALEAIAGNIGFVLEGSNGLKTIVINNPDHVYVNNPEQVYRLGEGKGVVIAAGDIVLTGKWQGAIITNGRVYVDGGSQSAPIDVSVDNDTVSNALAMRFAITGSDGNTYHKNVINLFQDYEDLSISGSNGSSNNGGLDPNLISSCITITNWRQH